MALLRAGKALDSLVADNADQKAGVEIVRRSVESPVRQIAENAGAEGSIIVGKLRENSEFGYGWNAQANEFGDLSSQGVIDPAKVVRTALQDAASVAVCWTPRRWWPRSRRRKRRSPLCRAVAEWTSEVSIKSPASGSGAGVYLSRYTHRVAISNSRLIAFDESGVTFRYNDYRRAGADRQLIMTLGGSRPDRHTQARRTGRSAHDPAWRTPASSRRHIASGNGSTRVDGDC